MDLVSAKGFTNIPRLTYVNLQMFSPCRPPKQRLLVFTLGTSLFLMSGTAQTAQPEPNEPATLPKPTATNPDTSSTPSASTSADRTASEWITNEGSLTVELNRGTTLTLGPRSRVLRLPSIPVALGEREYSKTAYSVELVSGRLEVQIDPTIRPIYGVVVRAPRKVGAIAKSGTVSIVASNDRVSIVARSGKYAMAAIGERWRPLRVGQAFVVSTKSPQGDQYPVPPAPALTVDTPVAMAIGTSITGQRLSFSPIANAATYRLRIYQSIDEKPSLVQEHDLVKTSHSVNQLTAGRYWASVCAVDGAEIESASSPRVDFRIVEAVLPPGAIVDDNAIYMPVSERLQLLHVEGLEIGYGNSSDLFVPAPQSIGFIRDDSLQFRLRERGSKSETRIRLEPLDLKPTIEISPARAVWPGTPISISIVMRRRAGSSTSIESLLVPTISINNRPTKVNWASRAGKMSCVVEKPASAGPWVVRVLVRDTRGRDVARDFIEVAVDPKSVKF